MRRSLLGLAAWASIGLSLGHAQVTPLAVPSPDLSTYAKTVDLPQPAAAPPPSEVVGGGMGSTMSRYALSDHTHPRITRAAVATTDVSGNWSVTWATALTATPAVLPIAVNTGGSPIVCNVVTRTTTSASGKCWLSRTLPAVLTLLTSLISYDVFGIPTVGTSVQVFAIPTTQ